MQRQKIVRANVALHKYAFCSGYNVTNFVFMQGVSNNPSALEQVKIP